MTTKLIWHYTTGKNLKEILRAGVLLPSKADGVVWFSQRQDWDPATGAGAPPPSDEAAYKAALAYQRRGPEAAAKTLDAHQEAMSLKEVGGLARIGVSPSTAPLDYAEFVRKGGHHPGLARVTQDIDGARGSDPADWRLAVEPVPAQRWEAIEVRSGAVPGERWKPYRPKGKASVAEMAVALRSVLRRR